jgi:hypothetical protein
MGGHAVGRPSRRVQGAESHASPMGKPMSESGDKPSSVPAAAKGPEPVDVALVHGRVEGGGYQILRRRGDRIEAGLVHPVVEGKPIVGELVALKPRRDFPLLCDVETLHPGMASRAEPEPRAHPPAQKGPAQVATDRYRDNWDAIFGARKPSLLN